MLENLQTFLIEYGGYSGWLFILALPPQITRNLRLGKYTSGSRLAWWLFVAAYLTFGTYLLATGAIAAAVSQYVGFLGAGILLIQSYTMPWAE